MMDLSGFKEVNHTESNLGKLTEHVDMSQINVESLDKPLFLAYEEGQIVNEHIGESERDIDTPEETVPKEGGSYKEVFTPGEGDRREVHHMPANDVNGLSLNDGPAIKMDKEDHRQTASCGNSREARAYREAQKELIDQGKFREALQMDIDDIHEKFGDKYDEAIDQMLQYVDQIEMEGMIA